MDDDDIRPAKVKLVPAVADAALSRSGVGIAHTVPGWLAVLYGLLFVVQLPLLVSNEVQGSTLSLEQQEPLAGTSEASLPTEFDGWTHVSYELVTRESSSNYGTYSNTWTFRRESATAIVCLDYPFTGWHSLEQCYLGQGWSVRSWQLGTADQALDPLQQPFVQVELERPAGETALLLFSLFDREAQPLVAPPAEVSLVWSLGRLLARLDSTFAKLGLSNVPSPVPTTFPTYQFQTLVSKPHALTSEDRQRAIELFAGARSVVLKSWQTKP